MNPALLACLALVLVSCSGPRPAHVVGPSNGHARFEVLGMMREYISRPLGGGPLIERFYPDEVDEADHFEILLGEFCAEESIPRHWQRTNGIQGAKRKSDHILFSGLEIAEAINRHYKAYNDGYHSYSPMGPGGKLSPDEFLSASEADLLRYVMGAYVRFGDHPSSAHSEAKCRALFHGANCSSQFELLAKVLARLGCTRIQLYCSKTLTPTSYLLTFCPNQKVKESTGIHREVSDAEMNKWQSQSHLVQYSRH